MHNILYFLKSFFHFNDFLLGLLSLLFLQFHWIDSINNNHIIFLLTLYFFVLLLYVCRFFFLRFSPNGHFITGWLWDVQHMYVGRTWHFLWLSASLACTIIRSNRDWAWLWLLVTPHITTAFDFPTLVIFHNSFIFMLDAKPPHLAEDQFTNFIFNITPEASPRFDLSRWVSYP